MNLLTQPHVEVSTRTVGVQLAYVLTMVNHDERDAAIMALCQRVGTRHVVEHCENNDTPFIGLI